METATSPGKLPDLDYGELDRLLDIAKAALFTGKDAAFYAPLMCSMDFVWDTGVDTAYTDGALIGFNPYSHACFASHHPQILRGLDSYSYRDNEVLAREQRRAYAALEHVGLAKPHFLVLGMDIVGEAPAVKLRDQGMPVLAWTVRSGDDRAAASAHADNIIFEGFTP